MIAIETSAYSRDESFRERSAFPGIFNILLVEDDLDDVLLMRMALEQIEKINIHVSRSGEDALDFLLHKNGYAATSFRPDLVILDLNLPQISGSEVLKQMKNTPYLSPIPVVILSTSSSPRDIRTCSDLNANAYIMKPSRIADLKRIISTTVNFWRCTLTSFTSF